MIPTVLNPPPRWTDQAACKDMAPSPGEMDRFFGPESGGEAQMIVKETGETWTDAARKICYSCPVMAQCLEEYMDEPAGVFGGMTGDERRKLGRSASRRSDSEVVMRRLGGHVAKLRGKGAEWRSVMVQLGLDYEGCQKALAAFLATEAGRKWDRDQRMLRALREGVPFMEVAARFRVSPPAVYNLAKDHGIKPPPGAKISPERLQRIKDLSDQGASVSRISTITRVAEHTVYDVVRKHREEIAMRDPGSGMADGWGVVEHGRYPVAYLGEWVDPEGKKFFFVKLLMNHRQTRRWLPEESVQMIREVTPVLKVRAGMERSTSAPKEARKRESSGRFSSRGESREAVPA